MRKLLGKPVSIMRRNKDVVRRNLTLHDLRLEIESGQVVDDLELGGCGCFLDDNQETADICAQDGKKMIEKWQNQFRKTQN